MNQQNPFQSQNQKQVFISFISEDDQDEYDDKNKNELNDFNENIELEEEEEEKEQAMEESQESSENKFSSPQNISKSSRNSCLDEEKQEQTKHEVNKAKLQNNPDTDDDVCINSSVSVKDNDNNKTKNEPSPFENKTKKQKETTRQDINNKQSKREETIQKLMKITNQPYEVVRDVYKNTHTFKEALDSLKKLPINNNLCNLKNSNIEELQKARNPNKKRQNKAEVNSDDFDVSDTEPKEDNQMMESNQRDKSDALDHKSNKLESDQIKYKNNKDASQKNQNKKDFNEFKGKSAFVNEIQSKSNKDDNDSDDFYIDPKDSDLSDDGLSNDKMKKDRGKEAEDLNKNKQRVQKEKNDDINRDFIPGKGKKEKKVKSKKEIARKEKEKEEHQQKISQLMCSRRIRPIETISFTTYIEIDMHGLDPQINRSLDWVPIIRDALLSSVRHKVDIVSFIPGKGIHSKVKYRPVLRPLVLLTSKRLKFNSYIDPNNAGVVICKISSDKETLKDEDQDNTELFRSFGVGKSLINTRDYDDVVAPDDDDDDISNGAFKAIRKLFPKMPKTCIEIICQDREEKEAVRFAKLFEKYFHSGDTKELLALNDKKKEELAKQMKKVESFEDEYGLDREIIEKVVKDKVKKNKIIKVLDRISDEIPDDFYEYLGDFVSDYDYVPIDMLLNTCKEGNYMPDKIVTLLAANSMAGAVKALNVLKVSNKIKTARADGSPKFIPSIEINLSNSGVQKAQRSIRRIFNGLEEGKYSEMVLQFSVGKSPKNKQNCSFKDIEPFVIQLSNDQGIHLKQRKELKKKRFHFIISNNDEEIEEEVLENEEEEDEESGPPIDFYKSYRNLSPFKIKKK